MSRGTLEPPTTKEAGLLLRAGVPQLLGAATGSRLRFGEGPGHAEGSVGHPLLFLDEQPAFERSWWCGTCAFLFERLEGANDTADLPELSERLAEGLGDLDPAVIETYGSLLGSDSYLPMLLEIRPRLTYPSGDQDYFSHEQVATWGVNSFWGLPEYPRTPYYRTFATTVDDEAHLYEFVVPMVPPTFNTSSRVDEYIQQTAGSSQSTAVAVSTLDVCAPATSGPDDDWYAHWGLTHFLLDGHSTHFTGFSCSRVPVMIQYDCG